MNNFRYASCLLFFVAMPLYAQEPVAVRKIVLPSLDAQVAARMMALDRRLNPVHSPGLAAALVAQAISPLDAFTPIIADVHNQEIWEQLPEEYLRMTQESGDALVTLGTRPPHVGVGWSSGQVRRLCHQRLAALPRASLELYRQRVDTEARSLLEQGRQSRSPIPLRRLVDDLFCSTPGDQALDLLGDLAFEKGEFDEARHWWSLLVPFDETDEERLLFPHPKVDLVRVRAKQILALIFQGRHDEAQRNIARLERLHPQARGQFAGQDAVFTTILQKNLASIIRERISNDDEPWTTFGGAVTRNRTVSQGLSWHLWEDGPAWSVALPSLKLTSKDGPRPVGSGSARRAAFHPVIVNNQVLIADHRSVVSYHLATGKEHFRYDLKAAGLHEPPLPYGRGSVIALSGFTLSVDHERAFVRLGALKLKPKKQIEPTVESHLVCLDLTQPDIEKKRELWRVTASGEYFEGAPLVHEGRVYIALSKIVGRHVVTSIVCYDVLGRRRWSREVCDCPEFEENDAGARYRHHLLTWACGQIVYCSHAGAIVAVDAWTGQPTWGVRYPSRGALTAEQEPSPRDLTPALYADGRLYAAPLDTDRLFCLDAVTGAPRWELEGVEIVHLLGASHGRLFTATTNGLMSIQVATGQANWTQPSEGRLSSLGRGLIAGIELIWPTQDTLLPYRAITLRTGQPARFDPTMLSTLPVGNLAFGQGCLAIAGRTELMVYRPGHQIKQLPPPDVRPHARFGRQQNLRILQPAGLNNP